MNNINFLKIEKKLKKKSKKKKKFKHFQISIYKKLNNLIKK